MSAIPSNPRFLREVRCSTPVRHITTFIYEATISESVMEARMQPRTDGTQRCVQFRFNTTPASRVMRYHDHEGNIVHHFNVRWTAFAARRSMPKPWSSATPPSICRPRWISAAGSASMRSRPRVISGMCSHRARSRAERPRSTGWPTEIGLERGDDPLVTLRRLMQEMHTRFEYAPRTTRVDSPIDEALDARKGVCQDFAHIFIALGRQLGLPCRYVSGYLFSQPDDGTRSVDGATHAWVETWLPDTGWVGWDPTNNLVTGEHHVRVAVGRDYSDVPPTRGVFKGSSGVRSELAVGVSIGSAAARPDREPVSFVPWTSQHVVSSRVDADAAQQQQQ